MRVLVDADINSKKAFGFTFKIIENRFGKAKLADRFEQRCGVLQRWDKACRPGLATAIEAAVYALTSFL